LDVVATVALIRHPDPADVGDIVAAVCGTDVAGSGTVSG
jgi:hypothetical protein